jgi:hypothetical protein
MTKYGVKVHCRSDAEGIMSSRCLVVIALAMTVLAPVHAVAKGAPTPVHVIAAVPPVIHSLPDISAEKLLAGCGGHRYQDVATHQCRSF